MKILITAIFVVAIALVASCDDSVRLSYSTRAEAEADTLFARGWLPEIIPASSEAITMENDLDLNISNGEFAFDSSDHDGFIARLTRTPTNDKNGTLAYSYEDWTFWIHPDKSRCEFRMILSHSNKKANKSEMATPRKPSD